MHEKIDIVLKNLSNFLKDYLSLPLYLSFSERASLKNEA